MNGTMARNDITVPLISCQFETSAVFILERLFVFIIGAPRADVQKGSIPSLFWPSSHHSGAICCFASQENDISKINAFIYFFLQSVFIAAKIILFSSSVNAFCTEGREMDPTETSESDAVLNIILSTGTLSLFMRREIMWKPDLLNNILVHSLQSFLGSFHFLCSYFSFLQSVQKIRWLHKSQKTKNPSSVLFKK